METKENLDEHKQEDSNRVEENILGSADFPIEGSEEVTYLNCRFYKINNLHLCPNLQSLCLRRNLIQSISGLECVPMLKELWLAKNKIVDIENLSSLTHLQVLSLAVKFT